MVSYNRKLKVLLLGLLAALTVTGCKSKKASQVDYKTYHIRGVILATSVQTSEVTIKHGDIPGLMPGMTMVYKVKDPAVVQDVQPGDQVSADLEVSNDNQDFLLDNVVVTAQPTSDFKPASLPPHQLMVGESVPDVPMLNQDGKAIHFRDYRGKAIVVTFIYTRCPMPTACPRISTHFSQLNDLLKKDPQGYAESHLISITLDPAYDKPDVMRRYGLAYTDNQPAEFSHWEFATTSPTDLRKLANAFGLEYSEQDNQINHTMETTVIGPDGKVVKAWEGSDWEPQEIATVVKGAEQRPNTSRKKGDATHAK